MPDLANIGPRGMRRRHRLGMAGIAAGAIATVLLAVRAGPLWHTLAVTPLFWAASLGLLQAREKTWVRLAARGARDLDGGIERVWDQSERRALRAQARAVHRRAAAWALLLTALALAARLLVAVTG